MDSTPGTLRAMLEAVARGEATPAQAEHWLRRHQIAELEGATLDLQRECRRGRPEAIFCAGKTPDQVVAIARRLSESGQTVMLTRVTEAQHTALVEAFGPRLDWNATARFGRLQGTTTPRRGGLVAVLAAGTSDIAVAEEAALTAEALGSPVERAYDVGVAGLHRLLRQADLLVRARVLVVVAGMEGALPSVVSGLAAAPVIAVPTSVGYGANFAGVSALLTMINSCSPGIGVVNIDNGFGAGYLADAINAIGDTAP